MNALSHLQRAIWLISPILQAAIIVGMVRKNLFREMPLFFSYAIFHVVQSCVAMIVYKVSYGAYFYVYWGSELLDALFTFIVIQEIFETVFRPYEALRSVGVMLFRGALLVLISVAILLATGEQESEFARMVAALATVQRSMLFVQSGLILFLFMFARLLGLTWRNYVFGISLGFGVMACLSGVAFAAMLQAGTRPHWLAALSGNAFTLGVMVWLFYIVTPGSSFEINRGAVDSSPLNGWNSALQELLNK